jgi:ABC-type taurine transport system ATPase subunit
VHGLAVLFLDGPLAALDSAGKQQIANRLLDVFQDGLN